MVQWLFFSGVKGIFQRQIVYVLLFVVVLFMFGVFTSSAHASMITSADFDGIKADVLVAGTGIIAIAISILGIFLIIRALSH